MRAAVILAWALGLAVGTLAQAPINTVFLQNMFYKPQLTDEQADAVAGVWNMTDFVRLDGPTIDQEVLAARDSGNYKEAMDAAIAVGGIELQRWIPAVDPKTGFLAAYQIYSVDGKVVDVQRWMGVALGQPDGSVVLQGTSSEDTGTWSALVRSDRQVMIFQEGVEVVDRKATRFVDGLIAGRFPNMPEIIDNAIVALYDFERLDGPAAEAVEAEVAKVLKTWWQ